jgi:hypothetical protein
MHAGEGKWGKSDGFHAPGRLASNFSSTTLSPIEPPLGRGFAHPDTLWEDTFTILPVWSAALRAGFQIS